MGLEQRRPLYEAIEQHRGRPLLVYVTSSRRGAEGVIAADVVGEILAQLQCLELRVPDLDFMIVSQGGDPTVAWRLVSLIRERASRYSVLVPQAAFSAATLIALGADEIVMHANGNLGPVDPQIQGTKKGPSQQPETVRFGSEDLSAFLQYAREQVGLTDQQCMLRAFEFFCQDVGAVPVGVAARSSQLMLSMGEKLLHLHMTAPEQAQQARTIVEALNRKFFHHGYPLSRREAREIGLKVAETEPELERLMWAVWEDFERELQLREPFSPFWLLKSEPGCQPLFDPVQQVRIPANLPPQVLQQIFNQILQQVGPVQVPGVPYRVVQAAVESTRLASHYCTEGQIFAARLPDLNFQVNVVPEYQGWKTAPDRS